MYTPIIGTLGYILSQDKTKVLLVHRNSRKEDTHLGYYNGLGGKMETNEDVYSCIEREIFEESGLICHQTVLRGTINWTGFGPKKENWLGFIFRIDSFSGTPFKSNNEGTLEWVPLNSLLNYPMWEGDKHFLPLVFDENPQVFHGLMPYDGKKCLNWTYKR